MYVWVRRRGWFLVFSLKPAASGLEGRGPDAKVECLGLSGGKFQASRRKGLGEKG